MKVYRRIGVGFALCSILLLSASAALATPYVLTDGSSSAVYDPESILGMNSWIVGGADHLDSQTFFVRTGTDTREISLDEIYQGAGAVGANGVSATFGVAGQYELTISYSLTEISAVRASISESITIQNLSGAALSLDLFQYNHFDLADNNTLDYVRILDNGNMTYSVAQQVELGVSGLEESTTQVNPASMRAETAFAFDIFNKLTDTDIDDLNNSIGIKGPGDMEFAFQWSYNLAAESSTTISKVKTLDVTLVPEPGTMALALLGLGAIAIRRRAAR